MKPPHLTPLAALLIAVASVPVHGDGVEPAAVATPTAITGIRAVGQEVEVTAHVPSGQRRVTLETRAQAQSGTWTPREVKWSGSALGELTFTVPLGDGSELFRVRDESEAELGVPASFFTGPKTFAPTKQAESGGQTATQTTAQTASTGVFGFNEFSTLTLGAFDATGVTVYTNGGADSTPPPDVSDSLVNRVFVTGDHLLQLRDDNRALSPRLTLTSTATPETPLATLPLEAVPVVGADFHEGHLFVVQAQPESWSNAPVVVSKQVIHVKPQPPLQETVTNLVSETVQPPPLTNYVTVTNIVKLPPVPLHPEAPTAQTNIVQRRILTPQPPYLVTNEVVSILEIPQPPLFVTNQVTSTNWVSARVPGLFRLSVVDVGPSTLTLAGQTTLANPTNYYGAPLVARWPLGDVLVWVDATAGPGYYPIPKLSYFTPYVGSITFIGNTTAEATPAEVPVLSPGIFLGSPAYVLYGGAFAWGGAPSRLFVAFDVADAAHPRLSSTTRLGAATDWSGFSDVYAADGKLFVSHDVTRYVPTTNQPAVNGNAGSSGLFLRFWESDAWEQQHFLDVLDFTDATNPVVRAPVDFPGTLRGISHHGQLVYAAGQSVTNAEDSTPYLHALAYDGVQASLVASLRRSNTWPQPLLVRADGGVLLGVNPANTNDLPTLETWAVSTAGTFERYATVTLTAPAQDLQAFGDLLVVSTGEAIQFFGAADAAALHYLGSGERPNWLSLNWSQADASPTTGLWLPLGTRGLWQVPIHP